MVRASISAAILALMLAGSAAADVGLILHRSVARAGQRMTILATSCAMPVYLVPESYARRLGLLDMAIPVAHAPGRAPFRLLGRERCTNKVHYIGDYPNGDWSGWIGYLRFRVPNVRPGRYQLVVYCAPCWRGPRGSLVVNNWLWRGSKRIGPTGLTIR